MAIGRELRFPVRHRPDLDALLERLTDLAWLPAGEVVLVWVGSEALRQADPRTHRSLVGVLAEAVERSVATERPLHVVLTSAQPLELPD